jgi:hypothetical protein
MRECVRWQGWAWLAVLFAPGVLGAQDSGLRYLPSDTKAVLAIHPEALGEREKENGLEVIRRLYFGRLLPELPRGEKLPVRDVKAVVAAWPHVGTFSSVIVVRGKIDRALLEKQCRAVAKRGAALTVEELGKPAAPVFRRKLEWEVWSDLFPQLAAVPAALRKLVAPQDVWVTAPDDETLFVSLAGKAAVVRALRARPAGTRPRTSDELTRLLKKQDPKDVASVAVLDDSLSPPLQLVVSDKVKETFEQFEHVTARVLPGKDVRVVIEVRGKSAEQGAVLEEKARAALTQLRGQLAKVVPEEGQRKVVDALLKGFTVRRKDAVVTLSGKLSEEDARKLLPVVDGRGR